MLNYKDYRIDCTRAELINALMTGGKLLQLEIVNGVQREDGSNHSYLVTGIRYCDKATVTLLAVVKD